MRLLSWENINSFMLTWSLKIALNVGINSNSLEYDIKQKY